MIVETTPRLLLLYIRHEHYATLGALGLFLTTINNTEFIKT